jgi:hypothetical protein
MPFSMIAPPAAAYPFPHASGDILFRPFKPPSDINLGQQEGGRYVWGDDTNGNGTLGDTVGGVTDRDIFPNIPPRPGPLGEIPMLPGNFARVIDNSNSEQMTKSRPRNQNRTLWYRTAGDDGNYPGEGENIQYNKDKNLFLNQLSFPTIGGGSSGQLKANLSSTGSLILPNTPCISLTDGTVDDRCISKSYLFGKNTPTDTTTTLLNLNLPYNPHFPSDNTSARNTTSGTQPATSFVVCGGTGNTRKYQAIQRPELSKTDISSGRCTIGADNPGEAVKNFIGTLPTGTGTTLTGGTGLLSAKLNPGNTGTDTFVGVIPSVSGTLTSTATPPAIAPVIRATNTYADNRVHVYNVNNLGKLDGGIRILNGTLTFRANCADPISGADSPTCTPTSVRRGSSPVFIMRGAPAESIEFSGLKIVLDGVDPNNIFWVSARANARLCLSFNNGSVFNLLSNGANNTSPCGQQSPLTNNEDPRLSLGQRIILSGSNLPGGISTEQTYYIVDRSGSTFKLSNTPGGSPIALSIVPPFNAYDTRLASEPSFIFSGGTPTIPNPITGATTPNIITGNFLGYTTATGTTLLTEDNTSVFTVKDKYSSFRGVRFLGLWGDAPKLNNETLFVAMTGVDQPALLPVLQLNVPNADNANDDDIQQPNPITTSGINGTPGTSEGQWTIRPTRTEVNVYFVAGSTPSRNGVDYKTSSTIFSGSSDAAISTGETGGGLANFVRFLENWESLPIKISGGFIQNTRSRFATAPWSTAPLSNGISDTTSVFLNPVQTGKDTFDGLIATGYNLQYMSKTVNRIPFYTPPVRLWGYDVALLTQQPDRFAERFAVPIAGSNEYFREVGGDEPSNPSTPIAGSTVLTQRSGTVPTDYVRRALRGNDLRRNCNISINNKYGGVVTAPNYTILPSAYQ